MNVLRIQELILRTNEAANWQKTKTSQPQLKIYWFFKKSETWIKVSLQSARSAKCNFWQVHVQENVISGKCMCRKVQFLESACSGKCKFWKMHVQGNVYSG